MRRSTKKILKNLTIFLSFNLAACVTTSGVNTKFDPQFEFLENSEKILKACLTREKVLELKEILIRIEANQGGFHGRQITNRAD